jgi:ABC-type lipoprotein release transport system permease subunit
MAHARVAFVGGVALVGIVTLAASLDPARRAAVLDPIAALKVE